MVKALREVNSFWAISLLQPMMELSIDVVLLYSESAAERMFGYTTKKCWVGIYMNCWLCRDDDHHKGWFVTFKGSFLPITEKPLELTAMQGGKSIPVEVTVSLFSLQEDNLPPSCPEHF